MGWREEKTSLSFQPQILLFQEIPQTPDVRSACLSQVLRGLEESKGNRTLEDPNSRGLRAPASVHPFLPFHPSCPQIASPGVPPATIGTSQSPASALLLLFWALLIMCNARAPCQPCESFLPTFLTLLIPTTSQELIWAQCPPAGEGNPGKDP